jgi:DNA-binding SARP family transcriptional activator
MDFRLLGPLEVHDGESSPTLTGAGLRALLTLLLLHANEVVSTDRLVDALWPDGPPPSGTAALQVRVSHLRKALGPAGKAVVTRPPGYLVEIARGELDIHRFEDLVARSDTAAPAEAAVLLRDALGLWRGAPLADVAYESFAQAAIARLEELRLAAVERRIEADLALGRHAYVVPELDALVAEHPLRERLRSQHLLALYRSGRHADALASFQTARAELVELGLEPGPVLRHLEVAILRHDPSLGLEGTDAPQRAILVVAPEDESLDGLVAVAEPLARKPPRELIVASLVRSGDDLAAVDARLRSLPPPIRTACFTTRSPAADAVRLATEQDVDLLLLAGTASPLGDPVARDVLAAAPCDVGILVARGAPVLPGPVVVPFTGGSHDWTAIELGAWFAGAVDGPLRLVGPREDDRDASRLLASASLATQRAFGVAAEPVLVEPSPSSLVAGAADAALVIVGLTDRWERDGLGEMRSALVERAQAPVLLARSGMRPGGLAPRESLTRFTWSVGL